MEWLVGTINKHIVHDSEGAWVGTFKDAETAFEVVNLHNSTLKEWAFEGTIGLPYKDILSRTIDSITENGNSVIRRIANEQIEKANCSTEVVATRLAASNGWTNNDTRRGGLVSPSSEGWTNHINFLERGSKL
jgi:hypothetical protein